MDSPTSTQGASGVFLQYAVGHAGNAVGLGQVGHLGAGHGGEDVNLLLEQTGVVEQAGQKTERGGRSLSASW
jgi:hypothetical protein